MAVIKQLCCLDSICKKIFPRIEQKIAIQDVENQDQITQDSNNASTNKVNTQPDILLAYNLLLQVVKLFEEKGKEAIISQIKAKMLELEPSFKESNYGFNKFKDFLFHAQKEKIITIKQNKKANNYIVNSHKS